MLIRVCFDHSSEVSGDKFTSLVQLKCLRALADPGEAVGLLAAQVRSRPRWDRVVFRVSQWWGGWS